jgi:hypothetical protein
MDRVDLVLDDDVDWHDEWQVQRDQVQEVRDALETVVAKLVTSQVEHLVGIGRLLEGEIEQKKLWERHETFKNSFMEVSEDLSGIWELAGHYLEAVEKEEM